MNYNKLTECIYRNIKANIEIPKEEKEIINILNNKFKENEQEFYNKCKSLIIESNSKSQYDGFVAGFEKGLEIAETLSI